MAQRIFNNTDLETENQPPHGSSYIYLAVIIVLLLLGGLYYITHQNFGGFPAFVPSVTVETVDVQDTPISFTYSGRTIAYNSVDVNSQVGGIIKDSPYTEGQMVKTGDVLFLIDPEPFKAALESAKGNLETVKAQLVSAEKEYKRVEKLYQVSAVSTQDYENAKAALDSAKGNVKQAEGALETAQINLGYTEVRAPTPGLTEETVYSNGTLVTSGTNLTHISFVDSLYVYYYPADTEYQRLMQWIKNGIVEAPADNKFTIRAYLENGDEYTHKGVVDFISHVVDNNAATVEFRAVLPNPEHKILPGQFLKIVMEGLTFKNAIAIKDAAVIQGPQGAFVYVIGADNQAEIRPVALGLLTDKGRIIESGLKQGDKVIVEGMIKVKPSQPVKVEKEIHYSKGN